MVYTIALAGPGPALLGGCVGGGTLGGRSLPLKPRKGGYLVEGGATDVTSLNPVLVSDGPSNAITSLMFDGLLGSRPTGELTPLIAAGMPDVSNHDSTYTFTIRRGIRWSDGRPLTSHDVAFTYSLMFAPEFRAVNSPRRGDLENHLASIATPDLYTVIFETRGVYAPFLAAHGRYGILPRHVLGGLSPAAINTADFNDSPSVVNGAFRFVRRDAGQLVLARNDTYYNGAPYLDGYIYKATSNTAVTVQRLTSQEIDFAAVDPALWDALATSNTLHRLAVPSPVFTYYAYQLDPSKPGGRIFGDKGVRQALLYALDRNEIARSVYFNQATVADSVEPPLSWAHTPTSLQYVFNKQRSERMLDRAGWTKGRDGIRAKNGIPMKFEVLTNQENQQRRSIVQVMQRSWEDIGVVATPRLVQLPQLIEQVTNTRTFDMYLLGFAFQDDPDESQLWSSASAAPGGLNGAQFRNAEADRLLDRGTATLDRTTRKEIYVRFQTLMADQVPAPTIVFNRGLWAVNERVQNLSFGPYNQYDGRYFMKDTWVYDRRSS